MSQRYKELQQDIEMIERDFLDSYGGIILPI